MEKHLYSWIGRLTITMMSILPKVVHKRVRKAVLRCNLKNDRMISVHFQGKPFSITVIQAEVGWFYEDLQYLLELTPKKDVVFIIGDWNAKVGSE